MGVHRVPVNVTLFVNVKFVSYSKKNPLTPPIGSTMDLAHHASTASVASVLFSPSSAEASERGHHRLVHQWFH
jgi:hypothetical protein